MTPGRARQVKASGVIRWQNCTIVRLIHDDPIFGDMALIKYDGLDRIYVKPMVNVSVIDTGAKYSNNRRST